MAEPERLSARFQEVVQFKGSCACVRISYQCFGLPNSSRSITACHCVTCRKVSGGPYQAYVDVNSSSVKFFDHKETLQYEGLPKDNVSGITFIRFSKVGERAYCADCNTPLAMRYKIEMDITALALGAVDEQSLTTEAREALRLTTHIFTSQKAWWLDIKDDGMIKHDRFKGDSETKMLQYESESADREKKACIGNMVASIG